MKIKHIALIVLVIGFASCGSPIEEPELVVPETTLPQEQGNMIVLSGKYYGKNLYVQNPFAPEGIGFCIYRIKVNGDDMHTDVNSASFEIPFAMWNLELGDDVWVEIHHKPDCLPKVLNPEVLDYLTDSVGNMLDSITL